MENDIINRPTFKIVSTLVLLPAELNCRNSSIHMNESCILNSISSNTNASQGW